MIFFGEKPLCDAVNQWLERYHTERNHQGLDNRLMHLVPKPAKPLARSNVASDSAAY
jgi:hypothetical protein